MSRLLRLHLSAALGLAVVFCAAGLPVRAEEPAEPAAASDDPLARACEKTPCDDLNQVGGLTSPDIPDPPENTASDPRGKPIQIPLPGAPVVRHRAGAGVFVGSAGENNNLFVNGSRSKATIGLRRDF